MKKCGNISSYFQRFAIRKEKTARNRNKFPLMLEF